MTTKLYVVPGSHPALAARLMLEYKGIDHRRVDLIPVIHKAALKALRFPGVTVPALRIDGRRVQGSRNISRELDELQPEPPLFPADSAERVAVEEAERWGDEVLQPAPRRIIWWTFKRDKTPMATFSEGARLGVPIGLAMKAAAPVVYLSAHFNGADDAQVRADLAALPEMLDRVDSWIDEGVLAGEVPNAADFQIATSVRMLMSLDDLRPGIEDRPAGTLAKRIVPEFPGRVGRVFPADWIQSLSG